MPPRLPDHQRAAILDDIRNGGTCRGIARKHGVAPATVASIARENNIDDAFERSQTKTATAAREVDNRSRRAELAAAALDVAQAALESIPNALANASARDLAIVYGVLVDKHLALERVSDDGADAARSMLARLGDALTEAAGTPPAVEDTDSGSR